MKAYIDTILSDKKTYFIDLFCGAGGVSTGISMARRPDGSRAAKVLACVNHDPLAILSHEANHPDVLHYTEDIRTLDLTDLKALVRSKRATEPGCQIHLWASLECTNFSKAKGGLPRDGDSRTLANHLFRYIDELDPDHIWIENVAEFMAWGPLDDNGKPLSRKNGRDYVRWTNAVQARGYVFDWRLMCCADYGDYTSRTRFFAQFARKTGSIRWPEKTHSRNPKQGGLFQSLKPWKPVKEVLDLSDHGESIFDRKKPLVENTLKRIYAGLIKFVAQGEEEFLMQYYFGKPEGKVHSLRRSAPTITTVPGETLVKPCFIAAAYGGSTEARVHSIQKPCPTVTVQQRLQAVLIQYNGKPGNSEYPAARPAPTLTTRDRLGLVQFLPMQFGQGGNIADIDEPAWSITTNPKHHLATAYLVTSNFDGAQRSVNEPAHTITADRHYHYLVNPQYNSPGGSVEDPRFTPIARMDKRPPHLITCEQGRSYIVIGKSDSETMQKIKLFMAAYGIVDIKMRMLNIGELKRITGLPTGYVLYGSKSDQKKFIGNAVPTYTVKAMVEANC